MARTLKEIFSINTASLNNKKDNKTITRILKNIINKKTKNHVGNNGGKCHGAKVALPKEVAVTTNEHCEKSTVSSIVKSHDEDQEQDVVIGSEAVVHTSDNYVDINDDATYGTLVEEGVSCRRKINDILQSLNDRLRLHENGVCLVRCTNPPPYATTAPWAVAVEVPRCGQSVYFYAVVRSIENIRDCKNEGALLRYVMELNYMKQATRGGSLSLDGNELLLNYVHPVCAIDRQEFENILNNIYDALDELSAKLDAKFPLE